MAIEIYDKAVIVKKNEHIYYFLKYGSKNSFTCGGQYVTGNDFRSQYLTRLTRDSHWSIIAHGGIKEWQADIIANTDWNCPTSSVYGQIRFGNKKNIALYFVKNKDKVLNYDLLDGAQQQHIDQLIKYCLLPENKRYSIDLSAVPANKEFKEQHDYCGTIFSMGHDNSQYYNGKNYWNLDNL